MKNVLLDTFGRASAIITMFFGSTAAAHHPVKPLGTIDSIITDSVEEGMKSVESIEKELNHDHAGLLSTITFTDSSVGEKVTVVLNKDGKPSIAYIEDGGSNPVAMSIEGLKSSVELTSFSADQKLINFEIQKNGNFDSYGSIEILTETSAWLTIVDAKGNVIREIAIDSNLMGTTLHDADQAGGEEKVPAWLLCATPVSAGVCALIGIGIGATALAITIIDRNRECNRECVHTAHSHTYWHTHGHRHGSNYHSHSHSHTYWHVHDVCHNRPCDD